MTSLSPLVSGLDKYLHLKHQAALMRDLDSIFRGNLMLSKGPDFIIRQLWLQNLLLIRDMAVSDLTCLNHGLTNAKQR